MIHRRNCRQWVRHALLHHALDELLACFLASNPDARPSETTVMQLLQWSQRHSALDSCTMPIDLRCSGCGYFVPAGDGLPVKPEAGALELALGADCAICPKCSGDHWKKAI